MPLFQTRYVTIRVHANDLHRSDRRAAGTVIGFKFELKSTDPNIIKMEKIISTQRKPTNNTDFHTVLIEDLYIFPTKNGLSHIFNAYPSPTLLQVKQNSTENSQIISEWLMKGEMIGVTNLTFHVDVFYDDDSIASHSQVLNLLVSTPKRRIDTIFFITIPFMVTGISILMGILLDTNTILNILKKPVPLLVGFVAQYGLMPFLAMAIAKLFHYTPLHSLALFVIGCCPGSGASNQWTVIFDGDVNLSAVLSFVSTATSFIMMPLYFYTLGRLYTNELSINVPYLVLTRTLAMVVIPYSIGIAISHFAPRTRPIVQNYVKPLMICIMIFFLAFGCFVYWHLFRMIDLYTILTAPLLPFLGFIFGGIFAWMSRLNWAQIKTIGIEAGIQNTGIAFMVMLYSFPQPYATQAMVVPMIVAFLSTKPFWIALIIRNQIRKYKQRQQLARTPSHTTGKLIATDNEQAGNNASAESIQKL
ncbi:unnamed protein product [Adineta ricciae]|uniref:Uncharacterized protein n=1 Tax=Adineta ricciae TaxID=249248 RepID=A0A815P929_ADIRI|nr:unnamed protein product [Adineta ricciae]CAF1445748.1 unnamed protein product [Adineta ricciae]